MAIGVACEVFMKTAIPTAKKLTLLPNRETACVATST